MKRFLLFVIYYLSTWTANAQEGTWYGKLDIQGTILPVVFHFSDDGCTLDSPAQGAKGIRAERISEGNHVKVAVPSIGVMKSLNNAMVQLRTGGGAFVEVAQKFGIWVKPTKDGNEALLQVGKQLGKLSLKNRIAVAQQLGLSDSLVRAFLRTVWQRCGRNIYHRF